MIKQPRSRIWKDLEYDELVFEIRMHNSWVAQKNIRLRLAWLLIKKAFTVLLFWEG